MKILYILASLAAYSPFNEVANPADLGMASPPLGSIYKKKYICPAYDLDHPPNELRHQPDSVGGRVNCAYWHGNRVIQWCIYNTRNGESVDAPWPCPRELELEGEDD